MQRQHNKDTVDSALELLPAESKLPSCQDVIDGLQRVVGSSQYGMSDNTSQGVVIALSDCVSAPHKGSGPPSNLFAEEDFLFQSNAASRMVFCTCLDAPCKYIGTVNAVQKIPAGRERRRPAIACRFDSRCQCASGS